VEATSLFPRWFFLLVSATAASPKFDVSGLLDLRIHVSSTRANATDCGFLQSSSKLADITFFICFQLESIFKQSPQAWVLKFIYILVWEEGSRSLAAAFVGGRGKEFQFNMNVRRCRTELLKLGRTRNNMPGSSCSKGGAAPTAYQLA
jgi:hypothetical protein